MESGFPCGQEKWTSESHRIVSHPLLNLSLETIEANKKRHVTVTAGSGRRVCTHIPVPSSGLVIRGSNVVLPLRTRYFLWPSLCQVKLVPRNASSAVESEPPPRPKSSQVKLEPKPRVSTGQESQLPELDLRSRYC